MKPANVNGSVGKTGMGTAPVFLTAISTILGAVLFLRFGYAVGSVGFLGSLGIILIGHLVTIPTSMAIAEIATNQKVEGGGEYYIISRSFGLTIGGTIGIALFFSQAISVAFYIIAFAEAFSPVLDWLADQWSWPSIDKRVISIPTLFFFLVLMLTKGANAGVKLLYVVVAVLFMALAMFFLGTTSYQPSSGVNVLIDKVDNPDSFFTVFAIIFPAFTGMTAGVGLSGDLKNPGRSIPLGTIAGTLVGMIMYVVIAYKLAISVSPERLVEDQLVMGYVALWAPVIPIGLACATVSSALGSVMVAPRTLQALGKDSIFPSKKLNKWLSYGQKETNEPTHTSIVTCLLALLIIVIGDIDFVAKIISMFFMVTYGSLCLISFLEHFASNPAYRPRFKSKWYISLLGAVMCIWLMFKMNTSYAILSVILILLIYFTISRFKKDERSMAAIFRGVIFQMSRTLQVFLQKKDLYRVAEEWRPSVVSIADDSFDNLDQFNMIRWIAEKYGFGTHIHLIKGYLSHQSVSQSKQSLNQLLSMTDYTNSNVYIDTIVTPSYTTAISQAIQLPGISGKENNMILHGYLRHSPYNLEDIIENIPLVKCLDFDIGILSSGDRGFGLKKDIQVWIKPKDYINANLMILLGYVILGHKEWAKASLKINAIYPADKITEKRNEFLQLIEEGRLPISINNINIITQQPDKSIKSTINDYSKFSDLTIIGFRTETVKKNGAAVFNGYDELGNILFVNASSKIKIH